MLKFGCRYPCWIVPKWCTLAILLVRFCHKSFSKTSLKTTTKSVLFFLLISQYSRQKFPMHGEGNYIEILQSLFKLKTRYSYWKSKKLTAKYTKMRRILGRILFLFFLFYFIFIISKRQCHDMIINSLTS